VSESASFEERLSEAMATADPLPSEMPIIVDMDASMGIVEASDILASEMARGVHGPFAAEQYRRRGTLFIPPELSMRTAQLIHDAVITPEEDQ